MSLYGDLPAPTRKGTSGAPSTKTVAVDSDRSPAEPTDDIFAPDDGAPKLSPGAESPRLPTAKAAPANPIGRKKQSLMFMPSQASKPKTKTYPTPKPAAPKKPVKQVRVPVEDAIPGIEVEVFPEPLSAVLPGTQNKGLCDVPPEQEYNPRVPNDYGMIKREEEAKRAAEAKISQESARHDDEAPPARDSRVTPIPIPVPTATVPYTFQIPPSRVLLLLNMADPGNVDPSLHSETHSECSSMGKVLSLLVYEVPQREVRIFVKFDTKDQARDAKERLHGRWFEGREVKAFWFDEGRFDKLDLAPRPNEKFT